MLERHRRKKEWELARIKLSMDRKEQAYIKKKELEYKRRMNNEIRALMWKEPREYKTKSKLKPLQFALELCQENAKLRDTDANGNGRCISCDKECSWGELAGGHRYSRQILNVCLEKININAQCHTCNYITWPVGGKKKIEVNKHYDENLIKKYWQEAVDKLRRSVHQWFSTSGDYRHKVRGNLWILMMNFIKENEELWKTKNFYKPKRKWREKRELYVRQNPEYKSDVADNIYLSWSERQIEQGEQELRQEYSAELEELWYL